MVPSSTGDVIPGLERLQAGNNNKPWRLLTNLFCLNYLNDKGMTLITFLNRFNTSGHLSLVGSTAWALGSWNEEVLLPFGLAVVSPDCPNIVCLPDRCRLSFLKENWWEHEPINRLIHVSGRTSESETGFFFPPLLVYGVLQKKGTKAAYKVCISC